MRQPKLVDATQQVLRLYETQRFGDLRLRSYEPVVGFARVKLKNMVQVYGDKVGNQEHIAFGESTEGGKRRLDPGAAARLGMARIVAAGRRRTGPGGG